MVFSDAGYQALFFVIITWDLLRRASTYFGCCRQPGGALAWAGRWG
jgi:hypothetical protein